MRPMRRLKTIFALIGVSAAALLAAEIAGRAAAAIDARYFDPPANRTLVDDDVRSSLPAYEGVDYDPRQLLAEVRKSDRAVYQPYTMWRRRAYRGTYTTVDVEGIRRTTGNSPSDDSIQVWMFGGSAVWGVGAPDHETIPSRLASVLNREFGIDAAVRNLGERGFVSTQEVIYLMRELQAGRRPDVVVFYGGVNDAAAVSLWPEFPGAHVSFDTVRDRFETDVDGGSFGSFLRSTGLYAASRIVLDRLEADPFERDGIIIYSAADTGSTPNYRWLAERGIDVWLFNARVVGSMAKTYGFMPLVLFQPGLWSSGKPLDLSEESLLASEMEFAGLMTLMTVRSEMHSVLEERSSKGDTPEWVVNLNDLFFETREPVYIDYVHVSERGNRIAARRIAEEVLTRLCARPQDLLPSKSLPQIRAACTH